MKEKILEIFHLRIFGEMPGEYNAAEDIAAHVMEFIEWIKSSECRYWFNPILHRWGIYDNTIEFEEVYQYWLTNVKK